MSSATRQQGEEEKGKQRVEIEEKLKELSNSKKSLAAELARLNVPEQLIVWPDLSIQNESNWLDSYSKQATDKKDIQPLSLDNASKFMEFYSANLGRLDGKKFSIQDDIDSMKRTTFSLRTIQSWPNKRTN